MREPRTLLADIAANISFFTRLPIASADDRDFAGALWAAPLAGAIVGLVGAVVLLAGAALALPAAICALMAIAAAMAVTGALHEDGLSDTVDGFFGGYSRQRRLEIMKDSRIGAFGAAALVFSIGLRAAALTEIGASLAAVGALVAAHASSRAILPAFMLFTPPSKPDGLAASVGAIPREAAVGALGIGALALLTIGPMKALIAASAVALLFLWLRRQAISRIGGHTGDVLGALQQVGEIAVLCVAAAALT